MAVSDRMYSIVEYFGGNEGYRCGYCKSDSNFSHGMWAHSLTVQDYQDLIDRGWRRSGQYIYKPIMHLTCCPMYTIKCYALDFKITKSQKKIIKRINRYLANGEIKSHFGDISQSSDMDCEPFENVSDIPDLKEKAERAAAGVLNAEVKEMHQSLGGESDFRDENINEDELKIPVKIRAKDDINQVNKSCSTFEVDESSLVDEKTMKKASLGADINKPICKKAKILRLERKKLKLQNKGMSEEEITKKLEKRAPVEKSLEDFINDQMPANPAHCLEIRLVNSSLTDKDFEATFDESYEVYKKYQIAIHGDPPTKCSTRQYTRFLVNSPLKLERNGPPSGYGSFHQQYWLDSQLIAVGVIDILPNCVSSVYFYYDPDYRNLSLGTYASLREASFVRSLNYHSSDIKYHYMGFYIDSCPKMRYKARFKPSFLLCPETYSWHAFDDAHKKLQISKYSRLNDDKSATDPDGDVNIDSVLVLYHHICMDFRTFRLKKMFVDNENVVKEYASLVGMKCAKKLLLVQG